MVLLWDNLWYLHLVVINGQEENNKVWLARTILPSCLSPHIRLSWMEGNKDWKGLFIKLSFTFPGKKGHYRSVLHRKITRKQFSITFLLTRSTTSVIRQMTVLLHDTVPPASLKIKLDAINISCSMKPSLRFLCFFHIFSLLNSQNSSSAYFCTFYFPLK